MQSIINYEFNEHLKTTNETLKSNGKLLEDAAKLCIEGLKAGKKILIFGNGGSAADAQHIAAELVGRYKTDRKGLAAGGFIQNRGWRGAFHPALESGPGGPVDLAFAISRR